MLNRPQGAAPGTSWFRSAFRKSPALLVPVETAPARPTKVEIAPGMLVGLGSGRLGIVVAMPSEGSAQMTILLVRRLGPQEWGAVTVGKLSADIVERAENPVDYDIGNWEELREKALGAG